MFFSSGTVNMVGSEEEYKNGDKSDIYFIIKGSHSNWENIEFGSIVIIIKQLLRSLVTGWLREQNMEVIK